MKNAFLRSICFVFVPAVFLFSSACHNPEKDNNMNDAYDQSHNGVINDSVGDNGHHTGAKVNDTARPVYGPGNPAPAGTSNGTEGMKGTVAPTGIR